MEYLLKTPINGASRVSVHTDTPLGKGATATVYRASINGKLFAAKIYKEQSKLNLRKIEAMIANPPNNLTGITAGIDYPRYSWPISLIESHDGKSVGYLMPLIDQLESFTLDYYYDKNLGKKLNSPEEVALSYKIEIAANLSHLIADLHSHRHCFVDCKPQNIRVFKRTHAVTLLDCDGFSINGSGGERFPAELLSTDYISPEAFRGHKSAKELGEYHDRYALATIIFQLLNGGIHPFQGIPTGEVNAATNDEKAALGLYPHGLIPDPRIKSRPQSIHNCFDDETRKLFDRAFLGEPKVRPSASEWSKHLETILQNKLLSRCEQHPFDIRHMKFAGKDCPECQSLAVQKAKATPLKSSINLPPIKNYDYSSSPSSAQQKSSVKTSSNSGASFTYTKLPAQSSSNNKISIFFWVVGFFLVAIVLNVILHSYDSSNSPKSSNNSLTGYNATDTGGAIRYKVDDLKEKVKAGTVKQALFTEILPADDVTELRKYLDSGLIPLSGDVVRDLEAANSWFYDKESHKFYIRLKNPSEKSVQKVLVSFYGSCQIHDNRKPVLLNLQRDPLKPYDDVVYSGILPRLSTTNAYKCADIELAYASKNEIDETPSHINPSSTPPSPSVAPYGYSSVYLDDGSKYFAWTVGYSSQQDADVNAKKSCQQGAVGKCKKINGGPYKCVAIYESKVWRSTGIGNSAAEAESIAKSGCEQKSNGEYCAMPDSGSGCQGSVSKPSVKIASVNSAAQASTTEPISKLSSVAQNNNPINTSLQNRVGLVGSIIPGYEYLQINFIPGNVVYRDEILISGFTGARYKVSRVFGNSASLVPVDGGVSVNNEMIGSAFYRR